MITILYIWTVVAMAGAGGTSKAVAYDWRPIGEYSSPATCTRAIAELGIKTNEARCVATGRS